MPAMRTHQRSLWIIRIQEGETILCGICGEPCVAKPSRSQKLINGGKGGITVDHIIPLAQGGRDVITNMQPAHHLCNYEKNDGIVPRKYKPKPKKKRNIAKNY